MNDDKIANQSAHPNLVLIESEAQNPICCLVLEDVHDEQLCMLGIEYVHLYRQGSFCVLLFELPSRPEWQKTLEEKLQSLDLKAGMSGPFALAASAHGCMRKAQLALRIGMQVSSQRWLYPMSEYSEAALLAAAEDVLAREGFTRTDFCDASVAQMMELDMKAGTQYGQSLRAYLSHGLNMRQAAQILGIHRNTLEYRIKRAQELFALNLEDLNTCFELLFSFWLMDNLQGEDSCDRNEIEVEFHAPEAQAVLWRCMERCDEPEGVQESQFMCRLLCVSVGRLADEERNKLLKEMLSLMPGIGACAFDEDLLAFVLPPQDMESFAAMCYPLCDEAGCRTVITQPFLSGRLMQHLRLCTMALYVSIQPHTRTQDMCSILFFMMIEKRRSLAPFLCEDVIRVMDDDAMRGTTLSRSLYAYLLNFRDMKRAADQLHIHRNTMEYQMRKIDALIGKPVAEKQRFLMMCTYKMLALPDMHHL